MHLVMHRLIYYQQVPQTSELVSVDLTSILRKAHGRPPPCVCMRASKRVQCFESLLLICVTLQHICQNATNIFSETFTNMFLFKSSSIHQFGIFYTYFIIRRVIILELIKLMTHSEAHHTNYSLLKRKTLPCGK